MPLTTDEVTLLRQEVDSWLTDVCDLYRETLTDDAFGGQGTVEALVTSGLACKLQSGVVHEQTVPEIAALRNVHVFTVSLPAETDVRLQDNLVITSKDNLKLRVQAVLSPETNELSRPVIATTEL
jgi:hypothetical protein